MNFDLVNDPPYKQLIAFLLIMLFSALILSGLAMVISIFLYGSDMVTNPDLTNPDSISAMKIIQFGSHLGLFVFPSIIFARLSGLSIGKYLSINILPNRNQFLMAIAAMAISIPLIGLFTEWNLQMHFPDWLSGVEGWMKEKEDQAKLLTDAILMTTSTTQFILNLIILAVLPAIGEEFVFRGFLIRFFSSFMKNIHLNIFIISILFSALHMQFYGFLPRFALGMFLGYLFYWSGSLWLPILVHFLNNALTITVYFLSEKNIISQNPDDVGMATNSLFLLVNAVVLVLILFWFNKTKKTFKISNANEVAEIEVDE